MLVIFAVIIGGIATGRLLIGRRLAFVPRLITVIIWALLFLLGVEVGSDPAVVGSSSSSTEGRWISAQHSASFCFMPPESFPARRVRKGSICR